LREAQGEEWTKTALPAAPETGAVHFPHQKLKGFLCAFLRTEIGWHHEAFFVRSRPNQGTGAFFRFFRFFEKKLGKKLPLPALPCFILSEQFSTFTRSAWQKAGALLEQRSFRQCLNHELQRRKKNTSA